MDGNNNKHLCLQNKNPNPKLERNQGEKISVCVRGQNLVRLSVAADLRAQKVCGDSLLARDGHKKTRAS